MNMIKLSGLALACAASLPVLAQTGEETNGVVEVAEREEVGEYLTTGDGRTLYLFVNESEEPSDSERMTEGVREEAAPCEGPCLQMWPPLTAEMIEAGEGVDDELLYTAEINGTMQAVYNGWPLYLYARDAEPGHVNGQGMGQEPNRWYVLSPEGEKIEAGAEEA